MKWKALALVVVAIVVVLAAQATSFGHSEMEGLVEKRVSISMRQKPLWDVFTRLIDKYDIAIGLSNRAWTRMGSISGFKSTSRVWRSNL